ncbi:unnamed protein product [Paramecium pentaurelia]|uniref:HSF-type DNA-binding domain-containing protein n=1 Tax=Paramecium pentaurelia TaxID=43138 RepID=A0A8S1VWL4_9CILI|nr:unnamed protein product [Paramecium pentaurelia]
MLQPTKDEFKKIDTKQRQKFLKRLYDILDNPDNFEMIRWSEGGFVIWNVEQMKKYLLPQHFKHNKFSSLMRQLNKYGFKIKLKEDEKAYFTHPTIRQNNREIKRTFKDKKLQINQEIQKELDLLNQELTSIKTRQCQLNKQMQISVKLMLKLQQYYENLVKTAYQSMTFTNNFRNLMYSNQQKIFGQVDGDLFMFAFNIIIQAFPSHLLTQNLTPAISGNITPLPFYYNNNIKDETKNGNSD